MASTVASRLQSSSSTKASPLLSSSSEFASKDGVGGEMVVRGRNKKMKLVVHGWSGG